MSKAFLLPATIILACQLSGGIVNNPDKNTAWVETFNDQSDLKGWRAGGGLKVVDGALTFTPEKKCNSFGRYITINPGCPYLVIDFNKIEPFDKGYRGMTVFISRKNAKKMINSAGGWRSGLWVFNLLDYLPADAYKKTGRGYLITYDYGGILSYKSLKMVARPENALLLSVDKNKQEIEAGDKIRLEVRLKEGGKDVTVSVMKSYILAKVHLGKDDYVQLTSEDKGKTWTGEMTVPEITNKKDLAAGELIFQANILGGKMRKLYTSNPWTVKVKKTSNK